MQPTPGHRQSPGTKEPVSVRHATVPFIEAGAEQPELVAWLRDGVRLEVVAVPIEEIAPADLSALESELARLLVDAWFTERENEK